MSDFTYITPKKYWDEYHRHGDGFATFEEVVEASKRNEQCENCGNKAWRLANIGLCFECTTGETDKSEDLELK